jgi:adenosylcobinamide-GDP ribazoletransferase
MSKESSQSSGVDPPEVRPEDEGSARPWNALLAAFQFLTILPPLVRRSFTPRELGAAVGWFPLVGVVLGLLLAVGDGLFTLVFPPPARSALILTLWVLLTAALHLDGFLDTCDGLLGGWTPAKRLEIMRDERVGAYALAGGVLLLLLKFSGLLSLPHRWEALILAPTLGRWGMSLAIVAFPNARKEGLGLSIKSHAGWLELILASLITLPVTWMIASWTGLVLFGVAALTVGLGAYFTLKRIPGLTGDIYGALNEIVEVVVFLGFVLLNGP